MMSEANAMQENQLEVHKQIARQIFDQAWDDDNFEDFDELNMRQQLGADA